VQHTKRRWNVIDADHHGATCHNDRRFGQVGRRRRTVEYR
jgi:hypothetical protein